MAINDLLKGMKLTLAAAVVATGMSGCRTPNGPAFAQGESVYGQQTVAPQYAQAGMPPRAAGESESEYRRRMEELRAQQSGFTYTSAGVLTPNEDRWRYEGVSERDVRRYDDYRQRNGWNPK